MRVELPTNEIVVGQFYYRKGTGKMNVRKVLSVGDKVAFEYVYGPQKKRTPFGENTVRRFLKWADGVMPAGVDFRDLDNPGKFEPISMLDSEGRLVFNCTPKKAKWFLRKGLAVWDEGRLRSLDNEVIKRLSAVYRRDLSNPFFTAKKNSCCVVCGNTQDLTRHHVVPRRHLKKVPIEIKRYLSNILWLCEMCHRRYERMGEPSGFDKSNVTAWSDHFNDTMKPAHLPNGWSILLRDLGRIHHPV